MRAFGRHSSGSSKIAAKKLTWPQSSNLEQLSLCRLFACSFLLVALEIVCTACGKASSGVTDTRIRLIYVSKRALGLPSICVHVVHCGSDSGEHGYSASCVDAFKFENMRSNAACHCRCTGSTSSVHTAPAAMPCRTAMRCESPLVDSRALTSGFPCCKHGRHSSWAV